MEKINYQLRLVLFLSFIFNYMIGLATPYVIESKGVSSSSKEALDNYSKIISNHNVVWGSIADVDIESLASADTLLLFLDNEQTELLVEYRPDDIDTLYTGYMYREYASLNKEEKASLSILENYIQGDIKAYSGKYYISSISENEIAIIKDESETPEEPEYPDAPEDSMSTSEEYKADIEYEEPRSTPVIRVLFVYTSSALTLIGGSNPELGMRSMVYTYLTRAQTSFTNSNVNARLELAYLGPISYNENNHTWDDALDHFVTPNDGYMDAVHTLRNKYDADVCVLFLNKEDWCGEAESIKADADEAFCIVWPSNGCTSNYTALHEIGHLIGCRHDYTHDLNLIPYMYGHGYYHYVANYPNLSWRTIMSYDNSCATGCDRILYWSNPNVYYQGNETGTTNIANNARVWNERAGEVSVFQTPSALIQLTSTNNNTSALYESYTSLTFIKTSGGYEVQSGQTVNFAATSTIELLPNTHIKVGANFRASIRSSTDMSISPQLIGKRNSDSSLDGDENAEARRTPKRHERTCEESATQKVLRDGQLLILRDGKTYTVTGMEIE